MYCGGREDSNIPITSSTKVISLKKYFRSILLWVDYRKLKDGPKVWRENQFNLLNSGYNYTTVNRRLLENSSLPYVDFLEVTTE